MADYTPLERAEARIEVLSRQLRESERRESTLRQDNDTLQERISTLLRQQHEPHSLDEVIHPRA